MSLEAKVLEELKEIVQPEQVLTDQSDIYCYASDGGIHRALPDAVVRPRNAQQVSALVKLANRHVVPVVPRGAGTALCGHTVPVAGGIVVDLQLMNSIREIRVDDLYCVVEPGVVYDDLNRALKPHRFRFPPGPGSGEVANIGGMIAANASGVNAIKYGATRDYVMGLEVVLPTGEIVHCGSRTLKNSGGYQFEKFFVGMEGTLGIITEITLRVNPLADASATAVAAFNELGEAGRCVSEIIKHPLIPAALEFMSRICIQAVNKATGMDLPECGAVLLIELDGHPAQVEDELKVVEEICGRVGAFQVDATTDPGRQAELFKGRKAMIPSLSALRDDYCTVMLADDMAVPMSRVAEAVEAFQAISDEYDIIIATYGHAGDGNLHTKVLMDPTKEEHWRQAEKAVPRVYEVVQELGGTTTGEHGVAMTKAPFFMEERADLIPLMKTVKSALDPNNIMNPLKIMDWEQSFISNLRYTTTPPGEDRALGKWDQMLNDCTSCGFCKSVCPVFEEVLQDSMVARGKVLLSYGLLHGEVEPTPEVADRIFQCTLCRDCFRRCPSNIQAPDIVRAARVSLVEKGFAKETHKAVVENVQRTGNIYGDTEVMRPLRDGEIPVYLGCQYSARPNQARKYLEILETLGLTPLVNDEICCGYPMEALGFEGDMEAHAARFRNLFPHREAVTFCPTCAVFLKEAYGVETKHILQVIKEKLKEQGPKDLGLEVTYHDPCDLARGAGIIDEPREILDALGIELVEMEQNRELTHCCGGGGGLLMSDNELADNIAITRMRQALETGVDTLVTACPTCEQNLRKAANSLAEEGERKIAVRGMMDLLIVRRKRHDRNREIPAPSNG